MGLQANSMATKLQNLWNGSFILRCELRCFTSNMSTTVYEAKRIIFRGEKNIYLDSPFTKVTDQNV